MLTPIVPPQGARMIALAYATELKQRVKQGRYSRTADLPRLRELHTRFVQLGLQVKADVVATQIRRLEAQ